MTVADHLSLITKVDLAVPIKERCTTVKKLSIQIPEYSAA